MAGRVQPEGVSHALATLKPDNPEVQAASILACELERRTERVDEVRKRCETLLNVESFKAGNLQEVLNRELEFITKKDSVPHAMIAKQEILLKESE